MTTDTTRLLKLAGTGDHLALEELLQANRPDLVRAVRLRMDTRVSARFDASDVVQDAMVLATKRLPEYVQNPQVPFFIWLRYLAWQRLIQLQRQHFGCGKRTVTCETHYNSAADDSDEQFVNRLAANITGPVARAIRSETKQRVRSAMQIMRPSDREILELRYLEQLETREIAGLLNITERAVTSRHFRALQRLQKLIEMSME